MSEPHQALDDVRGQASDRELTDRLVDAQGFLRHGTVELLRMPAVVEALARVRRETLEEAARVCEGEAQRHPPIRDGSRMLEQEVAVYLRVVAHRLRSLASTPEAP